MAAQRPNVIVYQEYENLTVAPDIADLNVLIVGPCYQILDYADDKADCYADDYGTLNSVVPLPSAEPVAVVIATPPNAKAGIVLDADSVKIFFDEGRAVLCESTAGDADEYSIYSSGSNLFKAHVAAAGTHFASLGIVAGDILIAEALGTGVADHVMIVKEVTQTLNDIGGTLDFLYGTGGFEAVQEGDIVTLTNDGDDRDGVYTITRVVSDSDIDVSGADWGAIFVPADVTTISIATATGTLRSGYPTAPAGKLRSYSDIHTTETFSAGNPATGQWRVERAISDVELATGDFSVSGNEITVAAEVTTDLGTAAIDLGKKISYAKIYVEYKAARTDLQNITEFNSYAEMEAELGKYDARNPLFVGAVTAKANTTTPVSVYGVPADTLPEYLEFLDRISAIQNVYSIVPLTYNTSILAAVNNTSVNLADPNYVLTNGIKQKFRVTIGALELETQKELVSAISGGTTSAVTGAATSVSRTLTLVQSEGAAIDFQAAGVIPGDLVTVVDASGPTTNVYTVAAVNGPLVLETDEDVVALAAGAVGDTFLITDPTGLTDRVPVITWATGTQEFATTSTNLDLPYLILTAATATFITSGCVPGDILQIPTTLTTDAWTTYSSYEIDAVISETQVRVYNNGTDTSEVENELPHLSSRVDGDAIVAGTMYLKVVRDMTKAQQVDEMVAVATSFGSKRMLLCYPDSVDVTSLVDGSLTRTVAGTPETATAQPGYYLACAVGGLTAGKPSQQGFTNMPIAGIDRIYNSGEYFKEEHITELSNGGVYVFLQDTPSALPYSVHEVTTDVTALEYSEYMVVKNSDFVATTYLDTMYPFLGEWNVLPSTVEFIRQALSTTGDVLASRYVAKIGAPLTDHTIAEVAESTLSTDRIEAYIDVDTPMTLNTIGLHLVG